MAVPLGAFIAVSAVLFFIGTAGVLVRRNAVVILMSVELMLNATNLALVAFSRRYSSIDERGSVFVVFIFVVAAAEVAVGLAIVLSALIAIGVFLEVLGGQTRTTVTLYEWIGVGDFHINVAALVDPLSSVMLLVVTVV